jgi:hypothetical protein
MNVTFACPTCRRSTRAGIAAESRRLVCTHCGQQIVAPDGAIDGRRIRRCLVCPSTELFVRKDFPQRLGVTLVVLGFVASSVAYAQYHVLWSFAILFVTALVDLGLYIVMGESLHCYRCHAEYRGFEGGAEHGRFDLETHERYRQMAARMHKVSQGMREQASK